MQLNHIRNAAHRRRRQRPDGAGRDGIDPDSKRTQIVCQIADRSFKSRFGNAHDVVVLDDAPAAQVGERHNTAVSALHQRQRRARNGNQRIRAHIKGDAKVFALGIGVHPLESFAGGIGQGMHQKIQLAGFFTDPAH